MCSQRLAMPHREKLDDVLKQAGLWCKKCGKPMVLNRIPEEMLRRMEQKTGHDCSNHQYSIDCDQCSCTKMIDDKERHQFCIQLLKEYWGIE